MDIVKRHLFLIICGVVGLAGLVLAFMGIAAMSEVEEEMAKATQVAGNIPGFSSNPVNSKSIEAEDERIKLIQDHHNQVLEWAKSLKQPTQLIEGCFPEPERDHRMEFRNAYQPKRLALYRSLNAGTVASAQDVADMKEQIMEEAKANQAGGLQTPAAGQPGSEATEMPLAYPSGVPTDHGASASAEVRANIKKANQIYCYALPEAIENITQVDVGTLAEPVDMWYAQLSLWVMEPVIEALASVNNAAAAEIEAKEGRAWVGVLPIKELISIRTSPDYVMEGAAAQKPAQAGGSEVALPIAAAEGVFTHNTSNDLYEVVQFTVKLVADARAIPTIIDAICRNNMTTLLRTTYEDMNYGKPDLWKMNDRIYGSAPVVSVVMDFETIFLGDLYRPLMPEAVLTAIGKERPAPPSEEE